MLSYADKSLIQGTGNFSKQYIKENELIGPAIIKLSETNNPDFDYIRMPLGQYVNHSNLPNTKIFKIAQIYCLIATRDINPNEELTVNYNDFDFEGKRDFM